MTWTDRPRSSGAGGLAWVCAGAGEPLVLIHGVGLRAEAWAAQADALGARYRVCLVDLPGHGGSAALDGAPDLAAFTARVAAAVASLGAPVLVAGHSMGALIALDLAIRHPALCRGVAALNAVYRRSPQAAEAVRARAASLPAGTAADPAPTLRRWFGDGPDGAAAAACRRWLLGVDPAGYRSAYTVFAHEDGPADADLARLACPALFMTGADEPNSTPAMSREMARRVPDGRAVVVDGAAHMMPMTHPGVVNEALLAFFARCDGRGHGAHTV